MFWKGGVGRVHLLDSNIQGTLLLELYTRDGVGTMISRYI
jgi:amino-acid N-acetyltransferase